MSKKTARLLALLASLALLLAACGGAAEEAGGGETEPAETSEPATDTTEASTEETPEATGAGDGTLTIGTVLPETGSLAFLGPPEFAAAELAVQDINEAGGVLGNDVVLNQGDSGDTTTDIANQTVDRHIEQGADVIIGAASSAVSFTFIDKVTGAGVVHFSPANTSPDFTDYEDRDLYFRTAPSDVLQGRVLGEFVIEEGCATVGMMALQDPYGEGLLNNASETISSSGGEVTDEIVYDPQAPNFDSEVQQLVSSDPDCNILIGFEESALILSTMFEQGLWEPEKDIYLVDGNVGNALGEQVDANMEGIKGTLPGSVASDEFQDQLLEVDPDLQDFSYAGETYDSIIVSALAAEVAGSDAGEQLAEEIPGVTKDGTKCMAFEECKQLVEDGEDIDYDGQSGPIELSDEGDPQQANFQILAYDSENTVSVDETREASIGG
ncbi:MAG: ABC transporter substrate-binding protein [Actinobacteria bacterium]|nr:ABC transporter substrate-binding protein [Actinomycetota bacterium]